MSFDYATASPAEIRAEAARRAELRKRGLPFSVEGATGSAPRRITVQLEEEAMPPSPPPKITGRCTLTLPWSCLCSENDRLRPVYVTAGERTKLRQTLTPEYKAAKARARTLIADSLALMGNPSPLNVPVRLHATLYEPDRRVWRDVANYEKLVHDALNGLVYTDDRLIDDVRWTRGPVDIDRPRLEITVASFDQPMQEAA